MVYESIFSSDLGQAVLAFLLVFTLVFAVLQKSKILGDGKKQIDAMISLAIALIVISVGFALDFIQKIIPFMAVALVILFVFLLLLGILFEQGKFKLESWIQMVLGIIVFVAVVIAVLIYTGGWDYIKNWFSSSASIGANVVLVVVIIVVLAIAYFGAGKESGKKE